MLMKSNFSRGSSSLAKHFLSSSSCYRFTKTFIYDVNINGQYIEYITLCDVTGFISSLLPLANWRLECTTATRYYRNFFFQSI